MRELELTGAHILKTQEGIALHQEYRQRLILGPCELLKGHPVLMLARDDLPQPWEKPRPAQEASIPPPKEAGREAEAPHPAEKKEPR
jgi:hypothetical protein